MWYQITGVSTFAAILNIFRSLRYRYKNNQYVHKLPRKCGAINMKKFIANVKNKTANNKNTTINANNEFTWT